MKLLVIGNNIGSIKDGIGGYIKSMLKALTFRQDISEVLSENGDTFNYGKIKRIFSLEMSKAIIRANKSIKKNDVDIVMVEYPFQEYNPLILPLLSITKRRVKNNGGKFVLSVHEYIRAKSIRKRVVRSLIKKSDLLFVSDEQTKDCFNDINIPIFTRDIPSNISISWKKDEKKMVNRDKYVYFGLINSSKAFDEMIEAWKVFNHENRYKLDILTSSDITIYDKEKYGIRILKSLSDIEIEKNMKNATFSIIPINNGVTPGSTTFKAAVGAGCIMIGMFDEEYRKESFIIDMSSYGLEDFVAGLKKTQDYSDEELEQMQRDSIAFSAKFSIDSTVEKIVNSIKGA